MIAPELSKGLWGLSEKKDLFVHSSNTLNWNLFTWVVQGHLIEHPSTGLLPNIVMDNICTKLIQAYSIGKGLTARLKNILKNRIYLFLECLCWGHEPIHCPQVFLLIPKNSFTFGKTNWQTIQNIGKEANWLIRIWGLLPALWKEYWHPQGRISVHPQYKWRHPSNHENIEQVVECKRPPFIQFNMKKLKQNKETFCSITSPLRFSLHCS